MKWHPPMYNNSSDPMQVENWIHTVDRELKLTQYNDMEKVSYAANLLQGPALDWWFDYYDAHVDANSITWFEFKANFIYHHVPATTMRLKRKEFLGLVQGTMIVSEYFDKFNQLSIYAPMEVEDDKNKQKLFLDGLNEDLQCQLNLDECLDFYHLVDKALLLENDIEGTTSKKRKLEDYDKGKYSSLPYPRSRVDGRCYFKDQSQNQYQDQLLLSNLPMQGQSPSIEGQSSSSRRSTKAKGACYFCKDDGHLIRQCPKKRLRRMQKKAPREDCMDIDLNVNVSVIHDYVDSVLSIIRFERIKK